MLRKCLRLSISFLAFLTGRAFSTSFRPTLVLAFLIVVIVTLFIVGSVPYQVLVRGCGWRTTLGKASLACLIWVYATLLFFPFGWLLFVISTDIPAPHGPPPMGQLIYLTLVATYGIGGAAICRWVNGRGQDGHYCCAEKSGCLERAA